MKKLNMTDREKRMGVKRVSEDHPIYKTPARVYFMNRRAASIKNSQKETELNLEE